MPFSSFLHPLPPMAGQRSVSVSLLAAYLLTTARPVRAASTLLSQGEPTTVSTTENARTPATAATHRRRPWNPLVQRFRRSAVGARGSRAGCGGVVGARVRWSGGGGVAVRPGRRAG